MTLGKYISAVYAATTHNGHSDNHYKNAYANVYIYTVYHYDFLEPKLPKLRTGTCMPQKCMHTACRLFSLFPE